MDKKPGFIGNIIAAIGFFILAILIIWGLINVATWAPALWNSISSLFGGSVSKTLTISLSNSQVVSGTATTVNWNHNAKNGTYAFAYECTTGASIDVPVASGGYTSLPCNNMYVVAASAAHAVQIKPKTGTSTSTIPFSVTYRDEKGVAGANAQATVTVTPTPQNNGGGSGNNGGSNGGGNSGGSTTVYKADLSVRLISFGIMLGDTFTPTTSINPGDTVAIRFEIKNSGNKASSAWRFRATLPADPTYVYDSVVQQSLGAGDYVVYTLKFTNLAQGGGIISVVADSTSAVAESNELNNGMTYQVTVHR